MKPLGIAMCRSIGMWTSNLDGGLRSNGNGEGRRIFLKKGLSVYMKLDSGEKDELGMMRDTLKFYSFVIHKSVTFNIGDSFSPHHYPQYVFI